MKGCAITALILFVLGAALAFAAGAARGTTTISEVVERVTGGRVHVNLGLGRLPFGIYVDDHSWFSDDDWNYELDDVQIYDSGHEVLPGNSGMLFPDSAENVTSLDISLGGCSFETRVSETDSFYIETQGMDKIQTYVEKGVLYIKSANTHLKVNTTLGKVILYVPEGQYYDEVDIEIGAGEVIFDDLNAGEISLEAGAGHILVKNLRAEELEASVGMGQLELYEMDVDELDAEVGMGELVGTGSINTSATLECAMGNLDLTLVGSQQDFNYRLEAVAGNVDIGRDSYSGLAAKRWIDNDAAKTLELECSMGNISIQFEQ